MVTEPQLWKRAGIREFVAHSPAPVAQQFRSLALLRRNMKAIEFSKPTPASGFFTRLFGKTVTSYALSIVFGAETVDQVESEIVEAKAAIKEWSTKRDHRAFVMVTAFAPQPVCDAIGQGMAKLCREDSDIAALLKGIPVELSFNSKEMKTI